MSAALLPRRVAMIFSVCFCFSLSIPSPTALADGNIYSDAALISSAQFLKELKEVSLTMAVDPWFTKYVSEDDLRADVTKGLNHLGIDVRSGAPVSLLVTMEELPATIRATVYYSNSRLPVIEDDRTHLCYFEMAFFVRAAALRGDKFHLLIAGATRTGYVRTIEENNPMRALLFGDENKGHLTYWLDRIIPLALDDIASRTALDETPWPASSWTDKQKAAGNEAYTLFMNSQPQVEKSPIEGLDVVPDLQVSSDIKADECKEDPSWKKFWRAEFQQFGWVRSEDKPPVTLFHGFACLPGENNLPPYFRLSDEVTLVESNLVFELNGRLVRKPAVIFQTHRIKVATKNDLNAVFQGYIPRSILEFVTNLKLGDQPLPVVKPLAPAPSAPAIDTAAPALEMKFVRIEPGMFVMGSPENESGRNPSETQHAVKLTKPFFMASNDVTRAQFAAFVADTGYKTEAEKANDEDTWRHNKAFEQDDACPVVNVSWNDAVAFADWLSKRDHRIYRLPTEAEWEYACRAGTMTPFSTGDTISSDQANYDGTAVYGAGVKGVLRWKTTPVGSFPPNKWGLYDMHGNVWQWCADVFGDYPNNTVSDPTGLPPDPNASHALRGGSWGIDPSFLRSASRLKGLPGSRGGYNVGFRLVSASP